MRFAASCVAVLTATVAFAGREIAVKTSRPEKVSSGDGIVCVGRIAASHKVEISARVTGTLWERKGDEGTPVKKGDLLYRIEDTIYKANLQTARAELAELETKLTMAETEVKRYSASEAKGGVSKIDLDRALLNRDVNKAKIEAAKAKVSLCENDLSYCTVCSPIDGVLGRSAFDAGNNVSPGSGMLRDVQCFDPIDVLVAIPESSLIRMFVGREVKPSFKIQLIRADGEPYPLDLKVFAVDNKVDPSTDTVLVRFRAANPNMAVLPGAYVKLVFTETFDAPKLAVPLSAVAFEGENRFLYVVSGGKAAKRKVALGATVGNKVFIAEGLKEGESFVSAGVHKMFDGAQVKER